MWQNLEACVVMSPLTDGTTDVNEDKCPNLERRRFFCLFPLEFASQGLSICFLITLLLSRQEDLYKVPLTKQRKRRISVFQNRCNNNEKHAILMSNLIHSMCPGHIWWSERSRDWKYTVVRVWDATSGVTMATVSQERASWQSNLVKIINVGVCLCLTYVRACVLLSPGWWGETESFISADEVRLCLS